MIVRLGSAIATPTIRNWCIAYEKLRTIFFSLTSAAGIGGGLQTRRIKPFSHIDWTNDKTDLRSLMGDFITYHRIPVGLLFRTQDATALSTAEAEYRAMTDVTQRAIYKQILACSFHDGITAITLENDNIPSVNMFKALCATKRSKFIYIRQHYLNQVINKKNIRIQHVPSCVLRSDLFTMALDRACFEKTTQMSGCSKDP